MNDKTYLILEYEYIMLAKCYSIQEVKDRLRELLKVEFKSEIGDDKPGNFAMRIDVWINGKFSGHSFTQEFFSPKAAEQVWDDVLKSDWFYRDNHIEIYESCAHIV